MLPDSYKPEYSKMCVYLARVYRSIKMRCTNYKAINFYSYGGRGIEVNCTKDEFIAAFYKNTDILSQGLTIDRVDNDGNYSLDNIRWVSNDTNVNNRVFDKRTNVVKIAKRLLSIQAFKCLKLENGNKVDIHDFFEIKFPLKTRMNEQLNLYIHKSLYRDIDFYIKRIENLYNNAGLKIQANEIEVKSAKEYGKQ